jgi:hypothetical protein
LTCTMTPRTVTLHFTTWPFNSEIVADKVAVLVASHPSHHDFETYCGDGVKVMYLFDVGVVMRWGNGLAYPSSRDTALDGVVRQG